MTQSYKKNPLIMEVAEYFGGIPKLSAALQIDPHAIYQWRRIPMGRAYQIEVLTNGYFTAKYLMDKKCTGRRLRQS